VAEQRRDLGFSHLSRMALAMEKNVAFDPIAIHMFGLNAVMLAPDHLPDLIEQFRFVPRERTSKVSGIEFPIVKSRRENSNRITRQNGVDILLGV
jgi:hypothetical protein